MTSTQLEDIQQEDALYPWLANGSMADDYNADLLDAMADMAYEQEQAMRESDQSEWELIEHDGVFLGFNVTNAGEYDDES